ncbi:MAG TPA: haloacid dehalogenase [Chloroflexota bacterium]
MPLIDEAVNAINKELEVKNGARDRALISSRTITRYAANAIRALHRGERDIASESLGAGRAMAEETRRELAQHPELYWSGYVQDSQKELAEAYFVTAFIEGERVPSADDIGVENVPYLNGMAEAASEMRRYVLDTIRRGSADAIRDAERILGLMDEVYSALITVDFPDALTGGLRRTTDALRAVLERTRGDLTLTIRQSQLEQALREYKV